MLKPNTQTHKKNPHQMINEETLMKKTIYMKMNKEKMNWMEFLNLCGRIKIDSFEDEN